VGDLNKIISGTSRTRSTALFIISSLASTKIPERICSLENMGSTSCRDVPRSKVHFEGGLPRCLTLNLGAESQAEKLPEWLAEGSSGRLKQFLNKAKSSKPSLPLPHRLIPWSWPRLNYGSNRFHLWCNTQTYFCRQGWEVYACGCDITKQSCYFHSYCLRVLSASLKRRLATSVYRTLIGTSHGTHLHLAWLIWLRLECHLLSKRE